MKIHKQLLIEKIMEVSEKPGMSYRKIGKKSGVNNISRIVSGEIKEPTAESWQCLHEAFPDIIPEPVYVDGNKVYKNVVRNVNGDSNQGKTLYITNNNGEVEESLTAEETTLLRTVRAMEKPADVCIDLVTLLRTIDAMGDDKMQIMQIISKIIKQPINDEI